MAADGGDSFFEDFGAMFEAQAVPSPYTGILAPELAAELTPEELVVVMRGFVGALKKIRHPDSVTNNNAELAELARDLDNNDPEVIAFRDRLVAAAKEYDEAVHRLTAAEADPLTAKVQALSDAHGRRAVSVRVGTTEEIASTTRRRRVKTSTVLGRMVADLTPEELDEEQAQERAMSIRDRQEKLITPESLQDVTEGYILCADEGSGQLFRMDYSNGEEGVPELERTMFATPVTLVKPSEGVMQAWTQRVFNVVGANEKQVKVKNSILTPSGGMKLAFNMKGPEAHFGRSVVDEFFREANDAMGDEFFTDFFQMAVLDKDGRYVAYHTALGKAAKSRSLNEIVAPLTLNEWAIGVYGHAPDVLYMVSDTSDQQSLSGDKRILYAYDKVGSERTVFSPDNYGLVTGNERKDFRLKLLGYLDNPDKYSKQEGFVIDPDVVELTSNEENTLVDAYVELRENLDLELRAGTVSDFTPTRSIHVQSKSEMADTSLVVAMIMKKTDTSFASGREVYEPTIKTPRLFAIKNPRAIGVESLESYGEFKDMRPDDLRKVADLTLKIITDAATQAVHDEFKNPKL